MKKNNDKKIKKEKKRFSPDQYQKNIKICIMSYIIASLLGCFVGHWLFAVLLVLIGFLLYKVILRAPEVKGLDLAADLPKESYIDLTLVLYRDSSGQYFYWVENFSSIKKFDLLNSIDFSSSRIDTINNSLDDLSIDLSFDFTPDDNEDWFVLDNVLFGIWQVLKYLAQLIIYVVPSYIDVFISFASGGSF